MHCHNISHFIYLPLAIFRIWKSHFKIHLGNSVGQWTQIMNGRQTWFNYRQAIVVFSSILCKRRVLREDTNLFNWWLDPTGQLISGCQWEQTRRWVLRRSSLFEDRKAKNQNRRSTKTWCVSFKGHWGTKGKISLLQREGNLRKWPSKSTCTWLPW